MDFTQWFNDIRKLQKDGIRLKSQIDELEKQVSANKPIVDKPDITAIDATNYTKLIENLSAAKAKIAKTKEEYDILIEKCKDGLKLFGKVGIKVHSQKFETLNPGATEAFYVKLTRESDIEIGGLSFPWES